MDEIEYEDDGDVPPLQPMPRRRRPDDESDGEAKRDRDGERTHDGVKSNGHRTTAKHRRVERRRRPRRRNDASGPRR